MKSPPRFLFRFDRPRESQQSMMLDIWNALSEQKSIFINAPTGIGKTDAAISACLSYALKENLNIFFLTPKNSQHKIAVDVLSGLRKKFNVDARYIDVVGKRNMCVNPDANLIEGEIFYKACEQLTKNKGCSFYEHVREMESPGSDLFEAGMKGHNVLFNESYDRGVCAYEVSAKIARESNFIIADYAHMLSPFAMQAFMRKIGHSLKDSIVIWDEAHNIMNIASSYLSTSLTTQNVSRASEELVAIRSGIDLGYLDYMLARLAEEKIKGKDATEAFVEKDDVLKMLIGNPEKICDQIDKAGLEYVNNSGAKRSSLVHISRFIRSLSTYGDSNAMIISRYGKGVKLSISCLYPTETIASMKKAYANVFMSGTLLPLSMHKELLGFPDAHSASYTSPFSKENRLCLLDREVSTRYVQRNPAQYKSIANKIERICERAHGNIAVFFPSFGVLDAVRRNMNLQVKFVQRPEMRSLQVENMIRDFKGNENNLLFAVMGGSLSEGIDYANNVIKGIIIVGIPLERPNLELKAKISYLDRKFNMKGNEYAYMVPGLVKAVQAAGRAIRSETDRAFIVFMDGRYSWSMYSSIMSDFMQIEESRDYVARISEFMQRTALVSNQRG